jgi:hypothetical protein
MFFFGPRTKGLTTPPEPMHAAKQYEYLVFSFLGILFLISAGSVHRLSPYPESSPHILSSPRSI